MVAGDVREGLNRLWLVPILAAFGFPLFIGLGSTDLANDEAIYSYAVESILTTGDWLSPRSSPNIEITFLEKPPLKFWIVAAPIRLGLLPYNEFGLRFWDALFGALAFVYVFLIGRRLAGPLCGAVAVLVLFAQEALLFQHGLRSNNMDAALVLAYAGGVYHYLRWSAGAGTPGRNRHIAAVAAWFFLGFMTKFVAALFLPVVLGAAALVLQAQRRQLAQDWWRWVCAACVVLVCAFPWFAYQYSRHGLVVWQVMFGEHVVTRFTQFADPRHVQPWHYYISQSYVQLALAGSALWAGWGLIVLVVQLIRQPSPERVIIVLWLLLPLTLISLGSSKLYHYFYPYLPPLALSAGAGVAWIVGKINQRVRFPAWMEWRSSGRMRVGGWALTVVALAVALVTAIDGGVRIYGGQYLLFRNTSLARPLLVAAVGISIAAGVRAGMAVAAVLLLQLFVPTPLPSYADNLRRLKVRNQPLRALADCFREVATPGQPTGVYAPVSEEAFLHPYFYYLRGTGWHATEADDQRLRAALLSEGESRPVVIDHGRYAAFRERLGSQPLEAVEINQPNVVILLPEPFKICAERMAAAR